MRQSVQAFQLYSTPRGKELVLYSHTEQTDTFSSRRFVGLGLSSSSFLKFKSLQDKAEFPLQPTLRGVDDLFLLRRCNWAAPQELSASLYSRNSPRTFRVDSAREFHNHDHPWPLLRNHRAVVVFFLASLASGLTSCSFARSYDEVSTHPPTDRVKFAPWTSI